MVRKAVFLAAGAFALASGAGTAMAATTARDYNVLVLNNFTGTGSDVEGWVAAGGKIDVSAYSIGDKKPAGAGQYAAVAGQGFKGGGGTVFGSSLATGYTGSFSYSNGGSAKTYAGGNASPINVASEINRLTTLSDDLFANAGAYGTVGTYQVAYNQLFLKGSDSKVNIFNISAADWNNTLYGWHLAIKPGSVAVFNIAGTNVGIANSGSDNGTYNGQSVGFTPQAYDASKVLYNFYDATRVAPVGSVNATILAPTADFESTYGVVLGQIFAKSFSGSIQVNNVNFQGTGILDHGINAVPEPATWAMMIAGFAFTGAALRRRRSTQLIIA
jgi:choice-of-anchor A domain-containing protein